MIFFFPFENVVFLNIDNFGIFPKKESGGIKIKMDVRTNRRNMEKRKKGKNRLIRENFLFEFPFLTNIVWDSWKAIGVIAAIIISCPLPEVRWVNNERIRIIVEGRVIKAIEFRSKCSSFLNFNDTFVLLYGGVINPIRSRISRLDRDRLNSTNELHKCAFQRVIHESPILTKYKWSQSIKQTLSTTRKTTPIYRKRNRIFQS